MATNPYLDLLDAEASERPDEAAPADNPYLSLMRDDEEERSNRLRVLGDVAVTKRPEQWAEMLEVSRDLRLPMQVTEEHFEALKHHRDAARKDWDAWAAQYPEFARQALRAPTLAPVLMQDEQTLARIRELSRLERAAAQKALAEEAKPGFNAFSLGPGGDPVQRPSAFRDEAKGLAEEREALESPKGEDPVASKLEGIERAALPAIQYAIAKKGVDLAEQGFFLAIDEARGKDTWEREKQISDLKQESAPRTFGDTGPAMNLLLDAAQILPSTVETGIAGGAGGLVGAGGGFVLGKGKGAAIGAKWLGRGAAGAKAFQLEMGSAYLDIRDMETDDGQPVSKEVALGFSVVYGGLSAGLEVFSLGQTLKVLGPIGDALVTANKRAAMQELLLKPTARALLADIGKRWVKGATAEAGTEWVQSVLQDTAGWGARSWEAGEFQEADVGGSIAQANEVGIQTFRGMLVIGAGGSAIHLGSRVASARDAESAGQDVATILGLVDSPTTKAAPGFVAELIAAETEKSDAPVTHLYVDAEAFTTLFQDGLDEAATTLLGPDGPAKVRGALEAGEKLEVPVEVYLKDWGATGAAAKLTGDTTTRPGYETLNELTKSGRTREQLEAEAAELAKTLATEEPQSDAERRFTEVLGDELALTGVYSEQEAQQVVALNRAFIRTLAKRFGQDADALFAEHRMTVERAGRARQVQPTTTPDATLEQGDVPFTIDWDTAQTALQDDPAGFKKDLLAQAKPQIDTPAFQKWFGGSAATTKGGDPLIVYHGTAGTFTSFRPSGDGGIYLTTRLENAMAYAVGEHGGGTTSLPEDERNITDDGRGRVVPVFVRMENPHVEEFDGDVFHPLRVQAAIDAAKAAGSDGVILRNIVDFEGGEASTTYIAFDPKQVKSAIANRGTFSRRSPNILYQDPTTPPPLPHEKTIAEAEERFRHEPNEHAALVEPDGTLMMEKTSGLPNEVQFAAVDVTRFRAHGNLTFTHNHPRGSIVSWADIQLGMIANQREIRAVGPTGRVYRVVRPAGGWNVPATAALTFDDKQGVLSDTATALLLQAVNTQLQTAWRMGTAVAKSRAVALIASTGQGLTDAEWIEIANEELLWALNSTQLAQDAGWQIERVDAPASAGAGSVQPGRAAGAAPNRGRGAGRGGFGAPENTPGFGERPDARGFVEVHRRGIERLYRVVLGKKADKTTFLHESAHVFLEVFGELAQRPDAPQQIRDDYAAALKWLGAKDGKVEREHHEKWARAFEAYLYEGKAPTAELAAAFERFKLWMREVYRSLKALNAPLDDEIRGIFDRLLATDEEISRALRTIRHQPLWRSPDEAGMSPEEWQTYLAEQQKSTSTAARYAEVRALKERQRTQEQWWKEGVKARLADAEKEYDARGDVRAWRYLRKGEVVLEDGTVQKTPLGKLDKAAVEKLIGAERAKALTGRLVKEGGEDPAEVAQRFDFKGPEDMLAAVLEVPERKAWVKERAEQMMQDAFPDVLQERQALRAEVEKGFHGDATLQWLLREWKQLRKQAGAQGEPPIEAIRRAAEMLLERRAVRRLNAHEALVQQGVAAEKAALAAAKGNFAQAYVFQQQRLLNWFLYKGLLDARKERDAFEELLGKQASETRRKTMGLAGPEFIGASDTILEALGAKEPEQDPERPSLSAALLALQAMGLEPATDVRELEALVARPPAGGWKDLTVGQMRGVRALLSQLYTAARATRQVQVLDKRMEVEDLVADIETQAAAMPDQGKRPGSDTQAGRAYWAKQRVKALGAAMLDPEEMFRRLGPVAHKFFWRGFLKARQHEAKLAKGVLEFFLDSWTRLPKALRDRRYELVDASALPIPDEVNRDGATRDRSWMWMLALNWGNESNRERLLGGYGWTPEAVQKFLDANMTKEEWDFVQSVWDLLDKELWPEVAGTHERVNGVKPPKIEATAIVTPHGTYRGGYFPAKYDPKVSRVGARQAAEGVVSTLSGTGYGPAVSKSFTKGRAKQYADVVDLQWAVVPSHLAKVVRYVAYEEFVRSAAQVLPKLRNVSDRRLGQPYYAQLDAWLKVVANPFVDATPETIRPILSLMNWGRSRFVVHTLGYSLTVALADFTNPLVAIADGQVKGRHMTVPFLQMASIVGFPSMRRSVLRKSAEMRARSDQYRVRLRQELDAMGLGGAAAANPVLEKIRDTAWIFMNWTDTLTSTVIWEGGYRQAIARGLKEADAVAEADQQVARHLPSHDPAEQPAILRDKRSMGGMLVFFGYFSKIGNVLRNVWMEPFKNWKDESGLQRAGSVAHAAGRTLAVLFVVNVLGELISGRGPEEDEEWSEWMVRKLATSPMAMVPIIGPAVEQGVNYAVTGEWRPSFRSSPATAGFEALLRNVQVMFNDEREDTERLWAVLESLGMAAKVPFTSAQVERTGEFLIDLLSGEADVEQPLLDVPSGAIYGTRERKPKDPFSALAD